MSIFVRPLYRMGRKAAAVGLLTALATTSALASGATFVQKVSHQGFNATVSALKHSISANGMMVMGHINQKQVLSMTGLHLENGQSFLVGNPAVGKKLFAMDPAVGAVLPLRVYVWSQAGHTYVGYFEPAQLLGGINAKLAGPGKMMNHKFAAIVHGATQ